MQNTHGERCPLLRLINSRGHGASAAIAAGRARPCGFFAWAVEQSYTNSRRTAPWMPTAAQFPRTRATTTTTTPQRQPSDPRGDHAQIRAPAPPEDRPQRGRCQRVLRGAALVPPACGHSGPSRVRSRASTEPAVAEAVAAARGGRGSIEPKVRLNSSCDHRLSGRPVFEQTRAPCHTRELGIAVCYNFMPLRSTGHITFSRGCKDAHRIVNKFI